MNPTEENVKKEPEIVEEMGTLFEQTELLCSDTERLEQRLVPVMFTEKQPEKMSDKVAAIAVRNTPLSRDLQDLNDRLQRAHLRLISILNRLEI